MNKDFLLACVAGAAITTMCASCATQAETMPSASDLDRSDQRFMAMAQPEFDTLERHRKSGELTNEQYQAERATLEYRVHRQAVDAAWTAHSLAESDRKATGIPTPDAPQKIEVGRGGGGPSDAGSFYRSHNDTYGGQTGLGGMRGSMPGYQGGGSILGGGRPY